jgi:hypothetical protein
MGDGMGWEGRGGCMGVESLSFEGCVYILIRLDLTLKIHF